MIHEPCALLDRLLREPGENVWLEFKVNNADLREIGEYVSALANAAHGRPRTARLPQRADAAVHPRQPPERTDLFIREVLAMSGKGVSTINCIRSPSDRLEASLTATAATRRRLLDALLAEALAPVDQFEVEAAE